MSGGHDSRRGLPATPREIQTVLRVLSRLASILTGDEEMAPNERALVEEHGRLLMGVVSGFDGTVFPVPNDAPALLGYRVAQSLAKGGTPWV
ncbi:MAG TPA: hypothetical protein VM487_01180 [Phycisphaerae bacterium]|nr:hypothetical protein [Phycisphaerae bacterium]